MKFVLKWLINGVIVVCFLMYYADVPLIDSVITATALTLIAYAVGDQLILRATNNWVATISDAILAYLILSIAAYSMNWDLNGGEILVISLILGIAEWCIHRYIFQVNLAVQEK
jgi:hypothetical protein